MVRRGLLVKERAWPPGPQPISWPVYQEPPPGHQPYVPFISGQSCRIRPEIPTIGWK